MKIIVLGAAAVALASCASITRGTTESVVINYFPESASVTTSLGDTCTANPCTLVVKRKDKFTVTAKAPGYVTQTVAVNTKVSGGGAAGLAGNAIFGGVIGVGVDAASGASLDHFPNPVNINLRRPGEPAPVAPAAPAKKKKRTTPTS